jgi:hypothetical protein
MTEIEAKRIFDEKLPICDVLGLDVKTACIEAGVPAEMVDRFLRTDMAITSALDACITDPTQLPLKTSDDHGGRFACLSQKSTGLPMLIWSLVTSDRQQTPHVLVQTNHSVSPKIRSTVRVSIEEAPRLILGTGISDADLAAAGDFISRNRTVLLGYWEGGVDSAGLTAGITRSL